MQIKVSGNDSGSKRIYDAANKQLGSQVVLTMTAHEFESLLGAIQDTSIDLLKDIGYSSKQEYFDCNDDRGNDCWL